MQDATESATFAPDEPKTTIRVFGGIGIKNGGDLVSIGGPMQQRLLALLVVRGDSATSNDWLAEHLWNDEDRPPDPAPTIRTYMSRLRHALPEPAKDWIETGSFGYRFTAPNETVETRRFADLRERARAARDRGDPKTALNLLDEALSLYRGEPFGELIDLNWALASIEKLRLDHLEMQEERWEVALELGRHTQITGELASFTAENAHRDRAARQYALALYRSGRTSDALRVQDEHRKSLAETTGLEPSTAFTELEAAMLRGDASLEIPKAGRPLKGYRLLEQVGSGAFSIVWRAIQPSVDRAVAIKQIRAELTSRPEFIRRFEAEAQMVAQIEHPHIVPLIDFWRDPDSAYLVMRWLGGGTLERRLDDGPLSLDETIRIAEQIGPALATAHAAGVVHRDVKTANILFDESDNAFLADFGIALPTAKSSGPEAALSPGSPLYSSPEQLRQERLAPSSDIFSLGVVVFECLTGSLPFSQSSTAADLVQRQLAAGYPSIGSIKPDLPDHVIAAVDRATDRDPQDRFDSVLGFVAALATADGDARAIPAQTIDDLENPYQGLRTFDESDSHNFFGRDRLVDEFIQQLSGEGVVARCLAVVGPSGSGKSSVVRAGLVPALRAGRLADADHWFVTTMVPGSHPYEALEAALLRIAVNPPGSLLDQLRDGDRGILRSAKRCLANDQERVLVIVDQLEELFTAAPPDVADRFLRAIAIAVEDPASPLRIVATLRADYYDRPLAHAQFAPIFKASAIDVTPLAPDELERAITGPAARHGIGFEPGLVATIAAEASGQPAPLPLLQHAMAELFERRADRKLTSESYEQIGGLAGSLTARAEQIFQAGSPDEREAARRLFGQLVSADETPADLRRRRLRAELGTDDATKAVLDSYGTARLLTFDRDVTTREPTVEVAHEALLREWPRLAGWLDDDRGLLRAVARLSSSAGSWHEGGRGTADLYRGNRLESATDLLAATPERLRPVDREFVAASAAQAEAERQVERGRIRRLRRLVSVVGVALVLALIAGAFAFQQQRRAEDEAQQASARGLAAQASVLAGRELDTALLLAANAAELESSDQTIEGLLSVLGAAQYLESASPFPGPSELRAVRSSAGVALGLFEDGMVRSFNADTDEPLGPEIEVGRVERVESFSISGDGSRFSVISDAGVGVWDVASGAQLLSGIEPTNQFWETRLTSQGTYLLIRDQTGAPMPVFSVEDGARLGEVAVDSESGPKFPTASSDEQRLYLASWLDEEASEAAVYELPTLEPIDSAVPIDAAADGLIPSGDGAVVVGVDSLESGITFLDGGTYEVLSPTARLDAGRINTATAMWNPSSTRFAVGTLASEFSIFSLETLQLETELVGRARVVQGAGWLDDDRFFIVTDGHKMVWNLANRATFATPLDRALGVDVFRDGRYVTNDGEALEVQSPSGVVTTIELPSDTGCSPQNMYADPFGSVVIVICPPQGDDAIYSVLTIDVAEGQVLSGPDPVHDDFGVFDWAHNADGSLVAVAGSPVLFGEEPIGLLAVLDLATGRFTQQPAELDPWALAAVAWTPDASLLLTGGQLGDLLFVDPDSLEVLDRIPLTADRAITDITFDSSGTVAHVANEGGEVWSVDVATRTVLGSPLIGATAQFQSVTFSPDGRLAAATGREGDIRIWNTETGRLAASQLDGAMAEYVRFIDNDTLVSWGWGPILRWDIGVEQLQTTACRLAGRPLNADELELFAQDLPHGDVCS